MPPKNRFKTRSLKYLYQERHAHQIFMVEFDLDNKEGMENAHNLFGRMYNDYYTKNRRQAYGVHTVRDEWRSRDKATKPVELWRYITAGVYTPAEIDMRDKLRKLIFYYAAQGNCANYLVSGSMTPIQLTPVAGSAAETLLNTQGIASILAEASQLLATQSLPDAAGDGLEDDERGNGEGSASSRKTGQQGDAGSSMDPSQTNAASRVEFNEDEAERESAGSRQWGGLHDGDEGYLPDSTSATDADAQSGDPRYVPSDVDGEDVEVEEDQEEDAEDEEKDEMAPPVQDGGGFFRKHSFSELRKFREQHAADFPDFAGGSAEAWARAAGDGVITTPGIGADGWCRMDELRYWAWTG
ncbi:hypothetical protein AC579_4285 [Pseudocercospora musae]|uniref:Uncharacterized protein n=1 Tax=Pseudocercospora musae TaxID=113226 RepID=A0A139IB06_9PEZI|nr:hypothetical protein AC579_4285 [Pseudocercospora musae]